MGEFPINERAQSLLKTLVEHYISDGQPVGSRTLARDSTMKLSPATIRNVMADLEDYGLVRSPHTSAGRVPTIQGYRLFIDQLLHVKPLSGQTVEALKARFSGIHDKERLLSNASSLLSEISSMAGVVMLPRGGTTALRQIEFLPLSGKQVLVIVVMNDREVQNRIVETERPFSAAELKQISNFLNSAFSGRDLRQVRDQLLREMGAAKDTMDQLMATAISMAKQVFSDEEGSEGDYLLAGETNLMSYAEMADMNKLRQLFDAFSYKRDILHLLDQSVQAQGVQIFIGEESGYEVLGECSVVTSPYRVEGEIVGVLGVIGPTRMAYEKVIPLVDVTAQLLGSALNQIKQS